MNYITLRDGIKIPALGFGVFEIPNNENIGDWLLANYDIHKHD